MLHSGGAYLCSARALRVFGEVEFKSNELNPFDDSIVIRLWRVSTSSI